MGEISSPEVIGLFSDSGTPWYVKAGVGVLVVVGGFYLRLRKAKAEADTSLVDVQSSAFAALKQQIDQQAEVISDLQGEINSLRTELRQQQAAETEARRALAKVQIELTYARSAITEWHVIWEHITADAERQGFRLPPINPPQWPTPIGAAE